VETWDDVIQNSTTLNTMNPKFIQNLEVELREDLHRRMVSALSQVRGGMNADVFGFAEAFHRKYRKEWNAVKLRWDEVFAELDVEIKPTVHVKRPGLSTLPQGVPKDEVRQK
jgi:spore germination protein KC